MPIVTQNLSKYNKKGVGRVYKIRNNVEYPSITTIVNQTKDRSKIEQWKDDIGKDVANWIMLESMRIGTSVHEIIEKFFKNGNCDTSRYPLLAVAHFENIKPYLNNISAKFNEINVFSDKLKIAGTCDCAGFYQGVPSIIDFKTASRAIEDYIHDYFLQTTAYSLMVEERLGFRTSQIVVIMSGKDNTRNVWTKDPIDYVDELKQRIKQFYEMHPDKFNF